MVPACQQPPFAWTLRRNITARIPQRPSAASLWPRPSRRLADLDLFPARGCASTQRVQALDYGSLLAMRWRFFSGKGPSCKPARLGLACLLLLSGSINNRATMLDVAQACSGKHFANGSDRQDDGVCIVCSSCERCRSRVVEPDS